MKKIYFLIPLLLLRYAVFAQFPLVSIHDIQYKDDASLAVEDDLSNYDGDTVQIQGIVTMNPCTYGLSNTESRMGTFLQDPAGGPWNGIHVLIDYVAIGYTSLEDLNNAALFVDNFQVGNIVQCTGIVSTFDGNTQFLLLPIASTITGFSSMPDPHVSTVDTFEHSDGAGGQVIQTLTGEQYEGVYTELDDVYVTDVSYNPTTLRWTWYLEDAAGNKVEIRDVSGYFRNDTYDDRCSVWSGGAVGDTYTPDFFSAPVLGTYLSYVKGVINEAFSETEYTIAPLVPSDIGPALASPPVITNIQRSPVVATSTDFVNISATITDLDGTIASAKLYYSYGYGNTTFSSVSMTNSGGDTWESNIPPTGVDSQYVNFYVHAVDNDGNMIDYPNPSSPKVYITYDAGINSIVQIQNTPFANGNSVWMNDSIPFMNIEATVTATTATYDLGTVVVQESDSPWSGIFIKSVPGDNTDLLYRGDKIKITSAKVIEEFNVTKLTSIQYELISQENPLPDFKTGIDPMDVDGQVYNETEPWEGMLVKFNNQYVTSNNADAATGGAFGEWRVNSTYTPEVGMRCDDYSYDIPFEFGTDTLTLDESLSYIQGVMYYSFSDWKLLPRDRNDIAGYSVAYPNTITAFVFNSLVPPAPGIINNVTGTIDVAVPFGTDVSSLSPTVTYTGEYVSPSSATAQNFTSPVVYTCYSPVNYTPKNYTVTVSFTEGVNNLSDYYNLQLWPNPATDNFSAQIDCPEPGSMTFELQDITGRNLQTFSKLCNVGKNIFNFDTKALANGLYLLQISSSKGISVQR